MYISLYMKVFVMMCYVQHGQCGSTITIQYNISLSFCRWRTKDGLQNADEANMPLSAMGSIIPIAYCLKPVDRLINAVQKASLYSTRTADIAADSTCVMKDCYHQPTYPEGLIWLSPLCVHRRTLLPVLYAFNTWWYKFANGHNCF